MKNCLLLILLFVGYQTTAQNYKEDWHQCQQMYDQVNIIQTAATDAEGNFVVAGFINRHKVEEGNDSVFIRKYNTNGQLLWTAFSKFHYGAGINVISGFQLKMAIDEEDNIVISYPTITDSAYYNLATAKFSRKGVLQWIQVFDGKQKKDNEQPVKINIGQGGKIYVTAAALKGDYERPHSYVIAYDKAGKQIWSNTIRGVDSIGKNHGCIALDATTDSVGNVYVSGYTYIVRHDQLGKLIITTKINAFGKTLWTTTFGNEYEQFMPVNIRYSAYNNSVVIGGYNYGSFSSVRLLNYDAQGKLRWRSDDKSVKGIYGIAIDKEGNIVAGALLDNAGKVFTGIPGVCKYSPDGAIVWRQFAFKIGYTYNEYKVFDFTNDNLNHYYLYCKDIGTEGHRGYLIQKYDENGKGLSNIEKAVTDQYNAYTVGGKLSIDGQENIFTANTIFPQLAYYLTCINKYYIKEAITIDSMLALQNNITSKSSLIVYPNPTKGKLYLQAQGTVRLVIFNQSGSKLISQTILDKGIMNLSNLPSGIYFLKNLNINTTQKIVVEK